MKSGMFGFWHDREKVVLTRNHHGESKFRPAFLIGEKEDIRFFQVPYDEFDNIFDLEYPDWRSKEIIFPTPEDKIGT